MDIPWSSPRLSEISILLSLEDNQRKHRTRQSSSTISGVRASWGPLPDHPRTPARQHTKYTH